MEYLIGFGIVIMVIASVAIACDIDVWFPSNK